jgi:hypothetical protein
MFRGSHGIIKREFAPELCGNFVALPSLRSGLLTADKRGIRDFPKLPSATSYIPLDVIRNLYAYKGLNCKVHFKSIHFLTSILFF